MWFSAKLNQKVVEFFKAHIYEIELLRIWDLPLKVMIQFLKTNIYEI